jgi:peptidoglycan hydrolase-like protein with peptidoglycan-binding domain
LVAAFGLTWKGIGDFFGRVAAKGEEQLWNAEIDWAIAYRFTALRHAPANNLVRRGSRTILLRKRSNAGNLDEPIKEHLRRYNQWKKKWPDVLSATSQQSQTMTTPPTIAEGATGPTVRWAQYLLPLSYTQIDGIFGQVTKEAVERFQSQVKIAADGIVGPVTWGQLGGDGPQPPTLAKGSEGSLVGRLQTVLNEGGGKFVPDSEQVLTVDGSYGPITACAIEGAQRLGEIGVDGIVGPQTWALPMDADGHVLAVLCGVPGPGPGGS